MAHFISFSPQRRNSKKKRLNLFSRHSTDFLLNAFLNSRRVAWTNGDEVAEYKRDVLITAVFSLNHSAETPATRLPRWQWPTMGNRAIEWVSRDDPFPFGSGGPRNRRASGKGHLTEQRAPPVAGDTE
jgi:hypothetical protein